MCDISMLLRYMLQKPSWSFRYILWVNLRFLSNFLWILCYENILAFETLLPWTLHMLQDYNFFCSFTFYQSIALSNSLSFFLLISSPTFIFRLHYYTLITPRLTLIASVNSKLLYIINFWVFNTYISNINTFDL